MDHALEKDTDYSHYCILHILRHAMAWFTLHKFCKRCHIAKNKVSLAGAPGIPGKLFPFTALVVFASIFFREGLTTSCLYHRHRTAKKLRDTWIKPLKLSLSRQEWGKSPRLRFCMDLYPESNLIVDTRISVSINQINTFLWGEKKKEKGKKELLSCVSISSFSVKVRN